MYQAPPVHELSEILVGSDQRRPAAVGFTENLVVGDAGRHLGNVGNVVPFPA
jgi:hypothetical protein